MKTTVYNLKTGEGVEVEGVDAREYVATGGWSLEPQKIDDLGEEVEPAPDFVSGIPDEARPEPKKRRKAK